jgi:hypothetical protein
VLVRRSFASAVLPSLAVLALAACTATSEHAAAAPNGQGGSAGPDSTTAPLATAATSTTSSGTVAAPADTTAAPAAAVRRGPRIDVEKEYPVVRALYVNRFAAQSSMKMNRLIQIADETEINALVIDLKDEFGLNYKPSNPEWAKNAGTSGVIRNLPALLDTLRAHKILPIARLVTFKDSVTARLNPDHTIRRPDGSVWRDKKGLAWVNPYDRKIWEYNMGVAEELAQMGFGEIQFDYIRFPEPYKSLPTQVFPGNTGESKPDALAAFL